MLLIDQLAMLAISMSVPVGFFWWVTKDLERVAAKAYRGGGNE